MGQYRDNTYSIDDERNWKIDTCPKGYAFAIKRPEDNSVICTLYNGLTPMDKQLAKLLNAAPDMLLALETLASECSNMQLDHLMLVMDAIAKARGWGEDDV